MLLYKRSVSVFGGTCSWENGSVGLPDSDIHVRSRSAPTTNTTMPTISVATEGFDMVLRGKEYHSSRQAVMKGGYWKLTATGAEH